MKPDSYRDEKCAMEKIILILFFCFVNLVSEGQNDLSRGLELKAEKKWEESFKVFSQLLKSDSSNIDYLTNTSYLYSKLGSQRKTETEKQGYYNYASYLSQKAISLSIAILITVLSLPEKNWFTKHLTTGVLYGSMQGRLYLT